MKPQPGPGVPSDAFGTLNVMKREIGFAADRHRPERGPAGVDVALAEALHLDQPAPREAGRDREVAQRVRRRGRGRGCARNAHVDVDELRAERAAERLRQVARLQPEGHVGAGVVDLEPLDVEGARVEVRGRRVGVVAGAVVVAVRVGHVEEQRARHEVEEDGALRLRRRAARADGDDVEDVRAAGDRDVEAERAASGAVVRGDRGRRGFASVFVAAT